MVKPAAVGVRELMTRLGDYFQKVRRGQRIVVTDRGVPVAELRPIDANTPEEVWDRLAALGIVTPPTRPLQARRPILDRDVALVEAIRNDRDEGW